MAEQRMPKTIYVYNGEQQIARITAANREACETLFEQHYGSNDYTYATMGDDLCACDEIEE